MNTRSTQLLILALTIFAFTGCGGNSLPTAPPSGQIDSTLQSQTSQSGHLLLGLYRFKIDPDNPDNPISYVPLREGEMHLNIISFMQPPVGMNFGIEDVVDVQPGLITVDLFVKHPFLGADVTTVFDVCGIIISRGSNNYPYSDTAKFASDADVRLMNPDGFMRWWNPTEFPPNTQAIFGYRDGILGIPNSVGQYDATLNPYKYFATGMTDPTAGREAIDAAMRGALLPGTKSVRRYEIAFDPSALYFNYAIDANWEAPDMSDPDIVIPDDFPVSANRPEPYWIEIESMDNTLTYNTATQEASGSLGLTIVVYDWFGANDDLTCAYSQGNELLGTCNPMPFETGDGYAKFGLILGISEITSADDFMIWVGGECKTYNYQGFVPYEIQGMYIQQWVTVLEE
ncbi:MAG: hypothetical protein NTY09_05365 [bacterium]|nr:hypothetical protein [bacterium]